LRRVLPVGTRVVVAQGANIAEGATIAVPAAAFAGVLRGEYFRNAKLDGEPVLIRQDARIDFDFDHVSPASSQSSAAAVTSGEPYSVRWTGELKPLAPGHYRLRVAVDRCFDCAGHDGYRLWVDGKLALEDAGASDAKPAPDSVSFDWSNSGVHAVRLELMHSGEDQGIHLEWEAPGAALLDEALEAARKADVILALVGISPNLEGEALQVKIPGFNGGDREDLRLPAPQRNLLLALAKLNKPVILGVTSGSPVAIGEVSAAIASPQAVFELWYPGQAGGEALARLLGGEASPSGRLPVTVYSSADALPAFTDYAMRHRTYRYIDAATPVEYRFGFGLSYSSFAYSVPVASANQLRAGQELELSAEVRNTGGREADEVAELYLIPPADELAPRRALAGIERVHLRAGEARTVHFTLSPRQLSTVDGDGARWIKPGIYRMAIGGAQPDDPRGAGVAVQITGEPVRLPD